MTKIDTNEIQSPMAKALLGHDEKAIAKLAASGETLREKENPVTLLAMGFNGDDLDQFHTQSAARIAKVTQAAVAAGIDVNAPVNGQPASHYLTQIYVSRQLSNCYDTSQAAINGMTDDEHLTYLKAFAENGVDFSQRNEEGQSFVSVGERVLDAHVRKSYPETMEPGYYPEGDWEPPTYKSVRAEISSGLQDVKRSVQTAEVGKMADAKSQAKEAARTEKQKSSQAEL